MSWAAAVRGRRPPRKSAPQENAAKLVKPIDRIPVQAMVVEKFNELERRTQVLRKVPPTTTTTSILTDLKTQCNRPLEEVVEAVVQEPLDRRRFYVRYISVDLKRANARRGFKIGTITIPPEQADVQGYIPDLPHYMQIDDVVGILSQYGDVVSAKFNTFEETGIRCGGVSFEMDLHENKRLPGKIQILNDSFTLKLKDDIKQCAFCDRFGHIQRDCRKKMEDRMKRAAEELQMQHIEEQLDKSMDFDVEALNDIEERARESMVPKQTTGAPPILPTIPNLEPPLSPIPSTPIVADDSAVEQRTQVDATSQSQEKQQQQVSVDEDLFLTSEEEEGEIKDPLSIKGFVRGADLKMNTSQGDSSAAEDDELMFVSEMEDVPNYTYQQIHDLQRSTYADLYAYSCAEKQRSGEITTFKLTDEEKQEVGKVAWDRTIHAMNLKLLDIAPKYFAERESRKRREQDRNTDRNVP